MHHPKINRYLHSLKNKKELTEIEVDTLILIYQITKSEFAFDILYKAHLLLIYKLTNNTYSIYPRLEESYDGDIMSGINKKFVDLVLGYKIPAVAPFSKRLKGYLKKWLMSYSKLYIEKLDRLRELREDDKHK